MEGSRVRRFHQCFTGSISRDNEPMYPPMVQPLVCIFGAKRTLPKKWHLALKDLDDNGDFFVTQKRHLPKVLKSLLKRRTLWSPPPTWEQDGDRPTSPLPFFYCGACVRLPPPCAICPLVVTRDTPHRPPVLTSWTNTLRVVHFYSFLLSYWAQVQCCRFYEYEGE